MMIDGGRAGLRRGLTERLFESTALTSARIALISGALGLTILGAPSAQAQFVGATLDNNAQILGTPGVDGSGPGQGGTPGGTAAIVSGAGPHFNRTNGVILGGNGGAGASDSLFNGGGGAGGVGVSFSAAQSIFSNEGTVRGGAGGPAGSGSGFAVLLGGAGGVGVVMSAGGIINNSGTIAGGAAGGPGASPPGFVAGGEGISGAGIQLANSGSISGGLNSDGSRANAVSFTGGVNRFTVQAGSSVTGNVVAFSSSDVLAFGGSAAQTFDVSQIGAAAQYRGFGSIDKVDSGTTTLVGTNNGFTGTTQVSGGTLFVNGSLAGSSVLVQSNATFGGTGTIGGLIATSASTIAPGANSIGQLTVNGNVQFRAGSTYQVEVTPTTHDIIVASGRATLQGGTVQVLAQNANYAASTTYTILTAAGGVSGQFANVTSNLAFLEPTLSYDGNNAFLTLRRNQADFSSVALTFNQRQVASALLSLSATNPLIVALLSRSALEAQIALTQLAGEVNASQVTSSFQMALLLQQAVLGRLTGGFGGPGGGLGFASGSTVEASYAADLPGGRRPERAAVPVGDLDPRMFSVWGSGFGSFGSTAGNGNAGTLTRDVGGFVIGADATIDRMWRIGVAGGYTNSNFDVRSVFSSGATETGFGALYGGARFGAVTARLGLLGAGQSTSTRRVVAFPGFTDFLSARFGGTGIVGFGEVGYGIELAPVAVEPFVGAAAIHLSRDGYTERGGAAALVVAQRDYDIQTVTAGVRASMAIAVDSPFSVRGQLAYRRAFGDVVPRALLAFAAGGTQFQTAGIPVDRDAVVAEAGVGWQATRDISLELAYTGQVGNRAEDHGVKGSFRWAF